MKKFNGKSFLMGLIIGALVCSSIAVAFASVHIADLKAYYRDIKVYLNDEPMGYTASNGAYAEPFIVDGTTYIPLRLFSEKLGQKVDWVEDTNSIYIGKHGESDETMEDIAKKVFDYAVANQVYPNEDNYRYERRSAEMEVLINKDVACVFGLPVNAVNMTTGEEEGGFADFYWYKKATCEIKHIGGGQDWQDDWVDINTGEWKGPQG